jgi:hypothetical protein
MAYLRFCSGIYLVGLITIMTVLNEDSRVSTKIRNGLLWDHGDTQELLFELGMNHGDTQALIIRTV